MKGWIPSKLLGKRCLYLAKEHDVEVGSTLGRENVIISVIQILKVIASWYYNVTSWPLHHEIRSHRQRAGRDRVECDSRLLTRQHIFMIPMFAEGAYDINFCFPVPEALESERVKLTPFIVIINLIRKINAKLLIALEARGNIFLCSKVTSRDIHIPSIWTLRSRRRIY